MCTHIHSHPHGSQTDTRRTHMNADSNDSLILLLSLAEQNGGQWVTIYMYICTCTSWVSPTAWFTATDCPAAAPGSRSPQLLALAHKNPQVYSPTPAFSTDHCTCTYTHRVDKESPVLQTWTLGLRLSWDCCGKGQENASFPPAAVLLYSSGLAPVGVWWADGTCNEPRGSWTRVIFWAPPPAIASMLLGGCIDELLSCNLTKSIVLKKIRNFKITIHHN